MEFLLDFYVNFESDLHFPTCVVLALYTKLHLHLEWLGYKAQESLEKATTETTETFEICWTTVWYVCLPLFRRRFWCRYYIFSHRSSVSLINSILKCLSYRQEGHSLVHRIPAGQEVLQMDLSPLSLILCAQGVPWSPCSGWRKLLPLLGDRSCWNTDVRGEGASRSVFQTCNSGPSWERKAGGYQPARGQGTSCSLQTYGMWATVYRRFCWDWNTKFRHGLFMSPQKKGFHFMSPGLSPSGLIRLSIIIIIIFCKLGHPSPYLYIWTSFVS